MAPRKGGRGVPRRVKKNFNGLFDGISEDILCEILRKLCAKRFAAAACVSRLWNRASRTVMSKPMLVTAVSVKQNPTLAVKEVVDGVLSKLIRPQFVIACFAEVCYHADYVNEYVKSKFGQNVPVITNYVEGVVGQEAQTDELTEVTCQEVANENEEEDEDDEMNYLPMYGLVLIVGWIPDMKPNAIPLVHEITKPETIQPILPYAYVNTRYDTGIPHVPNVAIDKFICDIKNYSLKVSGDTSPAAILLFGERHTAKRSQLLSKIDAEFPKETAIVGHFNNEIRYRSNDPTTESVGEEELRGVALVFARDQNKPPEVGRTEFHIPCMSCVSEIGSATSSVVSIGDVEQEKNRTYLRTEKLDSHHGNLITELDDRVYYDDIYIGIEKKSVMNNTNKDVASSSKSSSSSTSIALHGVQIGVALTSEVVVKGQNIKAGDTFKYYKSDFDRALSINGIHPGNKNNTTKVFGGLIFANMNCTVERFTRGYYAYTTPFIDRFEGLPLGGCFTKYIVKRPPVLSAWNKCGEEQAVGECVTSHKGIAYLLMSFAEPRLSLT